MRRLLCGGAVVAEDAQVGKRFLSQEAHLMGNIT